jgi:uncharacterized protein YjbJ (UPF0337 family)
MRGAVKQAVGAALGSRRLVAAGTRQRARGEAAREAAGARNRSMGTVKSLLGTLTGNWRLRAMGRRQRRRGAFQQLG